MMAITFSTSGRFSNSATMCMPTNPMAPSRSAVVPAPSGARGKPRWIDRTSWENRRSRCFELGPSNEKVDRSRVAGVIPGDPQELADVIYVWGDREGREASARESGSREMADVAADVG